jgi:hypothetical protein
MKRLRFLVELVAGWIGTTIASTSQAFAKARTQERPQTWADFIAVEVVRTGGRRYEHPIQMAICNGDYGRRHDAPRVRRAACGKICSLCRYIYMLPVWPDPNYRRPSHDVLAALEAQEYHR